jgi:hypothetical protein
MALPDNSHRSFRGQIGWDLIRGLETEVSEEISELNNVCTHEAGVSISGFGLMIQVSGYFPRDFDLRGLNISRAVLQANRIKIGKVINEWKENEGSKYFKTVDSQKRIQDHISLTSEEVVQEMQKIFPTHLLKQVLDIDSFLFGHLLGNVAREHDLDYVKYPFLRKYAPPVKVERDKLLLADSLNIRGAERKIFANYALKTDEVFDYNPYQIPRYALTDIGVETMTNFLGCAPEHAERCYSILRFVANQQSNSKIPLGITARDLRDFIYWTIDPSKRFYI